MCKGEDGSGEYKHQRGFKDQRGGMDLLFPFLSQEESDKAQKSVRCIWLMEEIPDTKFFELRRRFIGRQSARRDDPDR